MINQHFDQFSCRWLWILSEAGSGETYFVATDTIRRIFTVYGHVVAKTVTYTGEYDNGNSGTEDTVDWNNGQKQKITATGAPCVLAFTAPPGPGNFVLRVIQGTGGSKTITWPGTVRWPGGTAPTLSTAAGVSDVLSFYYNGTYYYGEASLNYAA